MDKIKLSKKNFTDIMQSGQGQSDNYGIYFQNEHKFNDKFSVIGALRYDRWSVKDGYVYDSNGLEDSPASRSDSALSPKIAFNYKLMIHRVRIYLGEKHFQHQVYMICFLEQLMVPLQIQEIQKI